MTYSVNRRVPCSVCGLDTLRRDGWYVVVQNRWLDRLKILTWHRSLASQPGIKSACGREHLRFLIGLWLDQDNLRFASPEGKFVPLTSDPGHDDDDFRDTTAAGHLVGELSVFREAFSRIWTGSPETLEAIVDALIPVDYPTRPLSNDLQLLHSPHEPPYGLSLH
jgi:hypothetical protein